MTRQSPFCQHCHGSTGMAFYPKVNGMMPETESARLRKQVPVLLKKGIAGDDVNRQQAAEAKNKSVQWP